MPFALIDCNNFYASCEEVFNPKLKEKPLVVLSNNDGCVIARSKKAKELGIPMGAAAFECRELFLRRDVAVVSSNFALYGDMSSRVMSILSSFGFNYEIYSIDEAFLEMPEMSTEELGKIGREIRAKVLKWTGISVSVGIAPSKTLAKAANHIAKKQPRHKNVLVFKTGEDANPYLEKLPAKDIWGIGGASNKLLLRHHIQTALQFKNASSTWVQKRMKVNGLRTHMELHGKPCIQLDESPPSRKGIVTSRTFKSVMTSKSEVKESIAAYIGIATEKLRKHKLVTAHIMVFIQTSRFDKDNYYSNSAHMTLPTATSSTPHLITAALKAFDEIYVDDLPYKRAGVALLDLTVASEKQLDLIDAPSDDMETLMTTIDWINRKYDKKALFFAAEGTSQKWQRAPKQSTPHYTTRWEDILNIKLKN